MKRSIFAFFLVVVALSANILNKVMVEDPDALCLDGTKAAYYVHQGDPHKFILSFQGGAWCGSFQANIQATLQSCYDRSKTPLGSSAHYPPTMSESYGIFSDNQNNPFRNWTIIQMRYCDGTGHQGFKKDPVLFLGVKLWFRGHNATKGQLNSIDAKYKIFSEATDIIITGQSAGGLAVFQWANYISDRAVKGTKVRAVPDSGIFLDSGNYISQQHTYRSHIKNFMSIANAEVDPPTQQCVQAYKSQKWKCMFAQYIHPFIKVPLFAVESLYDAWSVSVHLGIECGMPGSFSSCTKGQMEVLNQYRFNTSKVLKEITKNGRNGCWAIACSNHVYTTKDFFDSPNFRVPANSENKIASTLKQWYDGSTQTNEHIDTVLWPDNRPCSGLQSNLSQA